MNRAKRAMPNKLRKKMTKEIRVAQAQYPSPEARRYSDELTAKEMLKKYPKKRAKKISETVQATGKRFNVKKKMQKRNTSKRTTPGTTPANSTPAVVHREGGRWIKTLTQQAKTERVIQAHRGKKK